jgi:hypothetical protein
LAAVPVKPRKHAHPLTATDDRGLWVNGLAAALA